MKELIRKNDKIEGIQFLRAIAILLTLFHHTVLFLLVIPPKTKEAIYSYVTFWSGVDLFFAISGFVIMKSFMESLEKNNNFGQTLKQFWVKRFFRILPMAWLWLAIYLLGTEYFNASGAFGELSQNIKDSTAAALQYANFYGMNCWGPNRNMQCGPNAVYWSLSLEEQFYFLLPIFIYIFRQNIVFVLLASIIGQFFLHRTDWSPGWAFRFDAISWGVLLAILFQKGIFQKLEPKFLKHNKTVSIGLLLILLTALVYFPAIPNQYTYGTGIVAMISAVLLILSFYDHAYLFPFRRLNVVLNWIGSRSFSLYLIHMVIFAGTIEVVHQTTPIGHRFSSADNLLLASLSVFFLVTIAELNYRFIEIPLRNLGLKLSAKISSKIDHSYAYQD